MGCFAEVQEPTIAVKFKCKLENQKYLIELILMQGAMDLKSLAMLLEVNVLLLSQAVTGLAFLNGEQSIRLAKLFLLYFSE